MVGSTLLGEYQRTINQKVVRIGLLGYNDTHHNVFMNRYNLDTIPLLLLATISIPVACISDQ